MTIDSKSRNKFLALIKFHSYAFAAKELKCRQDSIALAVKKIEAEYGAKLVRISEHDGRVYPTQEGKAAVAALSELKEADEKAALEAHERKLYAYFKKLQAHGKFLSNLEWRRLGRTRPFRDMRHLFPAGSVPFPARPHDSIGKMHARDMASLNRSIALFREIDVMWRPR